MYYDKRTEVEPVPVKHREYTAVQQSCLEAAEYIRTYGWCQGTFQNQQGRVCILGAVRGTATAVPYNNYYIHLSKALQNPVSWNDTPSRTVEEVIAALEAAAEMEE